MPGRCDIMAGRAFVELFVKDTLFQRGLLLAQARLRSFESALKATAERFAILGRAATFFGLAVGGAMLAAISKLSKTHAELTPIMDAFKLVRATVERLVVAIARALTPSIQALAKAAAQAINSFAIWVEQHQEMVVLAAKVVVGITAAGIAMLAFSSVLKILAGTAGVIATALGVLAGIPPIVLAIRAEGAVLLANYTGVFGQLAAGFQALSGEVMSAFTAIKNALVAGDLEAAVKIFWALLKLEWTKGVAALTGIWENLKWTILTIWDETINGLVDTFINGQAMLETGWVNFTTTFMNAWDKVVMHIQNTWDALQPMFRLDPFGTQGFNKFKEQREAKERETAANAREDERARRQTERELAAEKERTRIQEERAAKQKAAEAARQGYQAARDKAHQAAAEAASKEVEKARGAFESAKAPFAPGAPGFKAAELPGIPKAPEVAGTFSAPAAIALGGTGGPMERAAKAAEQNNNLLKKIDQGINRVAENTNKLGAVFV